MNMYNPYSYELYHHGILGQKWGVRKYQYEDGSLTPEGRKRYGLGDRIRDFKEKRKEKYISKKMESGMTREESEEAYEKHKKAVKTTLLVVGGVTIAAAVGYATYKSGQNKTDSMLNSNLGNNPPNPPTHTANKSVKSDLSRSFTRDDIPEPRGRYNKIQPGDTTMRNRPVVVPKKTADSPEAPWNIPEPRSKKVGIGDVTGRNYIAPTVGLRNGVIKPRKGWNTRSTSKYGDSLRDTTKSLASDKANLSSQAEELRRRNEMLKRSLGK